jgi:hypothetical protein
MPSTEDKVLLGRHGLWYAHVHAGCALVVCSRVVASQRTNFRPHPSASSAEGQISSWVSRSLPGVQIVQLSSESSQTCSLNRSPEVLPRGEEMSHSMLDSKWAFTLPRAPLCLLGLAETPNGFLTRNSWRWGVPAARDEAISTQAADSVRCEW